MRCRCGRAARKMRRTTTRSSARSWPSWEGDKVGAAIVGGPPAILLTRRARGGAAASPAEYQVALLSDSARRPRHGGHRAAASCAARGRGGGQLRAELRRERLGQAAECVAPRCAAARRRRGGGGCGGALPHQRPRHRRLPASRSRSLCSTRCATTAAASSLLRSPPSEPHAGIAVWPDALDRPSRGLPGHCIRQAPPAAFRHCRPRRRGGGRHGTCDRAALAARRDRACAPALRPRRLAHCAAGASGRQYATTACSTPAPGALSRRDRRRHWLRGPCLRGR